MLSRLRRKPRGQAMTEYVATTSVLLFGALAAGPAWPVFSQMIKAFDRYLDSIYFTLNLMLP